MDELLLPVAECVEDLSSPTKKSKPEQTSSGSSRTAFYIASAIGLGEIDARSTQPINSISSSNSCPKPPSIQRSSSERTSARP